MRTIMRFCCFLIFSMGLAWAGTPLPQEAINLNQATEQQLLSLKGIGQKRAAAIVAYRQSHGKFQTLQDLAAVPGISKNLLEKLSRQNEHRIAF